MRFIKLGILFIRPVQSDSLTNFETTSMTGEFMANLRKRVFGLTTQWAFVYQNVPVKAASSKSKV